MVLQLQMQPLIQNTHGTAKDVPPRGGDKPKCVVAARHVMLHYVLPCLCNPNQQ